MSTDLTPFQRQTLAKLPQSGAPTQIHSDEAMVLRAIPHLARVETDHDSHYSMVTAGRREQVHRAALLAAGIAALQEHADAARQKAVAAALAEYEEQGFPIYVPTQRRTRSAEP
jgi:hypothetical protein